MRRPLRFVDRAGRVVDLTIDPAPDATVGDLADHLAQLSGAPVGATVASRWPRDRRDSPPARTLSLAEHGPRAGSTVILVPERLEHTGHPDAEHHAPVRLVGSGGERGRSGEDRCLHYGTNLVDGAVVDVGTHVSVRATGGADIRVGGAALLGSARVADGDLLTVEGTPWTVRVEGPLRPPPRDGWTQAVPRRPRSTAEHQPATLELPTPPPSTRIPGFPILSAMVPLLMGIVLWYATGSWLAAGFMLFSVVFVVASGLEARREARREDRARVAEFRADVDDAVARIETARTDQRERHRSMGLDPSELRSLLDPNEIGDGGRLWERCSDADRPAGTRVRIGTADRPLEDRIAAVESGRRELRRELEDVCRRLSRVDDVVTVDLERTGGLVIEGSDEGTTEVARSIVLQLAALVSPDELAVRLLVDGPRAAGWNDLRWLPHCEVPRRRVEVVVADGADLQDLRSTLQRRGPDGVLVLWVTPPAGVRPAGIGAVLEVDTSVATLQIGHVDGTDESIEQIDVDLLAPDESEPLARTLAGLVPAPELWLQRPGVAPHVSTASLPESVPLADVVADPKLLIDPHALAARWAAATSQHLSTPVGIAEHGGVLNLDLANDGPHALVAGTTGAGKSELLRTFLVSAALHHSPQRLQYLLIDYKGGAAFGALDALPHTVGSITDLSGALATRALVSLRAELRNREEAVAVAGGERWDGPSLVVVVDEFATLAAELPDFVDGLVDLAQRGRSLGIHLVLATQRPAGVVTDSIRANITMRLALRVADEDDSRDVVDSPAAAHLPRSAPGRAVVRPGPGRIAEVQVAYSAAPHVARAPVAATRWDAQPWDAHSWDRAPWDAALQPLAPDVGDSGTPHHVPPTQLTVAVNTAIDAARLGGTEPPRRPWLDPLLDRIGASELAPSPRHGVVVIGVVDRPELQRRDPLSIDLARDGGLIVIGAGGTGRSTLVRTLAAALDRDPHEPWAVHVISNSPVGRTSEHLLALPAVGDVIEVDDTERVMRLLRMTMHEIDRRSRADGRESSGRRLVVVDGIAAMEERYERIDRGEAMDLLTRIAREGRSVGVHLVLTAQRRAEVPAALSGVLGARVLLRSSTADEAALLGLDEAAASPDLPPGRCWVDGHLAQIAHCDDLAGQDPTAPSTGIAESVPRLPMLVHRDELERWSSGPRTETHADQPGVAEQLGDADRIAIGLDGDTLDTVHLDLRHHHALVVGPPRSGVSTALQSLVAEHPDGRLLCCPGADELAAAVDAAIDAATRGRSTLLAIDGLPALLDGPDAGPAGELLERVLQVGRDHPLRLVAGGEVDSMSGCYHDIVAALRRERTGMLLGGDPELHGALFHAALRARSDLPSAPGRGWLLGPGTAVRVQVASVVPPS